jgi:hypothetical protein
MFGHEVLIVQQQRLIDGPRNVCEQGLPIHTPCTLPLFRPSSAWSMRDGVLRMQAGDWRKATRNPCHKAMIEFFDRTLYHLARMRLQS